MAPIDGDLAPVQESDDDHEALLALAADGKLASFAHTAPFSKLPEAVEDVAAGTVIGKTVITFDDVKGR